MNFRRAGNVVADQPQSFGHAKRAQPAELPCVPRRAAGAGGDFPRRTEVNPVCGDWTENKLRIFGCGFRGPGFCGLASGIRVRFGVHGSSSYSPVATELLAPRVLLTIGETRYLHSLPLGRGSPRSRANSPIRLWGQASLEAYSQESLRRIAVGRSIRRAISRYS